MKRPAIIFATLLFVASAYAQFVDLGDSMVFIRSGFDDSWTRRLPTVDDSAWNLVAPDPGKRSLEIRDLGLPGVPRGGRFSLLRKPAMEFTMLIPFQADLTLLNASDPALFLAHVGQRWAVYLNGVLLRNEIVRSGSSFVVRSLRDVVVPLDKRRLTRGQNILAFRLFGDPVDDRTGLNRTGPYTIDSYRSLASANRDYLDFMLIGVYAFFALYHGVLFALRPKDKGYLFFGVSALLFALHYLAMTNSAPNLVADTSVLQSVENGSLFLALPAFLAFLESLLWGKRTKFVAGLGIFCSTLVAAGIFVRFEPLFYAWLACAVVSVGYHVLFSFGKALVRDYRARRAVPTAAGGKRSIASTLATLLWMDDSGRLAIGSAVLSVAFAADLAAMLSGGGSLTWTKYAFFGYVLLSSSLLAGQFAKVSARAEAMNAGLEKEVEARTAALSAAASEKMRLNDQVSAANERLSAAMHESERDVRVAAAVQKGFFPARPPAMDDWDVAFVFEPADGISGDFYDFYAADGSLGGVVIGSVSGSGIASGLVTVLARNVFNRQALDRRDDPISSVLVEINRELVRELSAVGNTVSCTFLRFKAGKVEYANAGHTDALVRRRGQRDVSVVKPKTAYRKAPPLGRDDFDIGVGTLGFSMAAGDALLVSTAGLAGCVNSKGVPFGFERVTEAFRRADPENAESLLSSVMMDFRNHLAGARRSGDVAAMVLVRK
jgi:serine phosphatase RsbU (regulator of sigma subunit)